VDISSRKVIRLKAKLTVGYWENESKTNEVMVKDEEERLWMLTGDEGSMDKDGYLSITGRIKDIIIRGKLPCGVMTNF
jgi:long-subunit acyl-CoA synthetase (AMP-forming)